MPDLSYLRTRNPDRFRILGDEPTMKAVVTTGNGGYEKLDYRSVPVPVPAPRAVSVQQWCSWPGAVALR